jgi:hypothetical protein
VSGVSFEKNKKYFSRGRRGVGGIYILKTVANIQQLNDL